MTFEFPLPPRSFFDESISRLIEKRVARLMKHRERYVSAYCARFGIPIDEFGDYELVTREEWRGMTRETSVFMRKRRGDE